MEILALIIGLLAPITYEMEVEVVTGEITAYNATQEQTDSTPDIMADGTQVRSGSAACPSRLKFGTEIEIAGQTYICRDRMNKRYRSGEYYDILMESEKEALAFGRQQLPVTIYR